MIIPKPDFRSRLKIKNWRNFMYTIGQISKMFNLPVSTLRYYDKEGLFPDIQRVSSIRKFSDSELEALRVIEC
jgi:DNA-binding transcriptional MerR regulator